MLDPLGIYSVDEVTAAQLTTTAAQGLGSTQSPTSTQGLTSAQNLGSTQDSTPVQGLSSTQASPQGPRGGQGPVLIHALRGYVDAGSVAQVASQHVLSTMDVSRLVTFDIDQLLDYRSKRPLMEFDADRWSQYEDPFLAIDYVHDGEGNPFLMLHGSEPDLQWERVVAAIIELINRFDVSLVVGFHGIPMGVPHTRPLTLTAHGTRAGLTEDYTSFFGTVKVPSSLGGLLEYRLGEGNHDAMGFAIHVPHYVSQTQYPPAAVTALQHVERATGLELRTERLAVEGSEITAAIENEVRESREIGAVIKALEEAYDRFASQVGTPGRIIDADGPLPSAEELAAEFEKFLAEADGQGDEELPTLGGF